MDNKPDEKDGKTDGKEGKDGKTDGREGKDGKTDGKEGKDVKIDITQQKSEQEEQNSIKKVVSKRERPAEVKGGSKREVSEFKRSYALAKTPPVHSMFLISKKDDELEQKLSESSKASQRRDVQAKHTRGQTAEGRHSQRQKAERKQSQRELEGKRSQRELERKQSQRELERKQPPAETKQSDPKQAQDSNLMYKPMYLYSPSARQVFRQTVSKLGLMTGKIMGTERRRKNDKTDPNNKAPDDNRADELLAQSPTVASTPPSKPVDMMDDNDYTSFEPTDAVRRPARAE
ncbi:unnamed protein product [Nippostrongylus brasiliensis]|uniref:Pinin_SDK_memA domain-containing protein n=1 Tax=Nippostrongylus brasiliensis TaxID=27835 RepID=A0A0N4YM89_NIPBR|nr:hypothetical protein Q1695_010970 [Nippostrongylus brasiliensis]VDL81994.1 unnamed protein product [Nippostrongylus brasiliensis]